MQTQEVTTPGRRGYPNRIKPAKSELAATIDHIECRYSEQDIRKMYGCFLAGKGRSANYSDMPTKCRNKANSEDLDKIVSSLAGVWSVFKNK
ncbi:hypothetical protein [Pontibacter rugosus]|uniref:Uncharacterized protein n=1 Tax=Pontibacter rugosus TaxID=1745966 RepID=A0ABW3SKU8_9BACT